MKHKNKCQKWFSKEKCRNLLIGNRCMREKIKKTDVLIMGKCTKVLIAILESRKDCKSIENDPIDLLEATKEPNHSYQYRKYVIDSVYNNLISLINIKQG